MNGTDLSCTENLSANIGKRGYRGITGPKGRPESYNTQEVPKGQPGPDGSSRIDLSFSGENGEGFSSISSARAANFSYFIFPGSGSWGNISKFSLGVSFEIPKTRILPGSYLLATIDLVRDVQNLGSTSLLSSPLVYRLDIDSNSGSTKKFRIINNGDDQNLYTTISTPSTESLIKAKCTTQLITAGTVNKYVPTLEIYSLELI